MTDTKPISPSTRSTSKTVYRGRAAARAGGRGAHAGRQVRAARIHPPSRARWSCCPMLGRGDRGPRAAVSATRCGAISTSCRRARSTRGKSRCRPRGASCARNAATRRPSWRHLTTLHPCIGYSDERIELYLAQRPDPRRQRAGRGRVPGGSAPAPRGGARVGEDRPDHRREDHRRPAVGRQAALSSQDSGFGIRMELQVRGFSRSAASTRIWTMSRSSASRYGARGARAASPFDDRGC